MVHPILKGLGAFRRIAVSEMRRTTLPCPRHVPVATWSGVRPALRTAPQALARENGRRAEFLEEGMDSVQRKTVSYGYEGAKLKISCKDRPNF